MKKIKINKLDSLFSKIVRTRDGWTCVRCGKYYKPPTSALHCSHFWGRAKKSVRYDLENCDALCYGCHMKWESNKQGEYMRFKKAQLGHNGYRALEKRARTLIQFGSYEREKKYEELKKLAKEYGVD